MGILSLTEKDGSTILSLEDARRLLPARLQRGETFWLDLEAPGDEEASVIRELFGLEPTAVAEVHRPSQVPHLELFKDYALLVLHTVEAGPEGSRIPVWRAEIDCFLGRTYLITAHARPLAAITATKGRLQGSTFPAGADLVLHELVEDVIRGLYVALDAIADRIAVLEDRAVSGHTRNPMREVTALRRGLVRLRHGLGPEQQALLDISRLGCELISEAGALRFRLAADRLGRLWDGVEVERDLVDNVVEVYLGLRTDRLNLMMQRLTLITTIFMPLTLIAGIYGMNFRYMPELSWPYGYPAVLVLMVGVGYAMYRWFRARGWFGEP
ncbi:MAG TPA: magnesium/cobalt transporter CorA [Firmicutes bacterium]|nr:magnesium/cobalt transporter CorA [Bacillota bacterium]